MEKIQEEITQRRTVIRAQLLESLKEARAHGDLSENFEYHAAKKEKNQNESRIRYLEGLLKNALIVDDNSQSADVIGLNTQVTLVYEEDQEEEQYAFVTDIIADSLDGRLSIESPIYLKLKGHRVGDRVLIDVNPEYPYYVMVKQFEAFTDDNVSINKF